MRLSSFSRNKKSSVRSLYVCVAFILISNISCQQISRTDQQNKFPEESIKVVSRYENIFTRSPEKIPFWAAVDAPLLGNGDVGVCISGAPEKQVFWLGKNDFWKLKSLYGKIESVNLGRLEISIPDLVGAEYNIRQRLTDATTLSEFGLKESK